MAMYLSQTEVDKARAVGEQALKTVSFRNENERQNVWKALMVCAAAVGRHAWHGYRYFVIVLMAR